MAKPEWGTKRTCHNCSARFYDLHRDSIVCPVCDTVYDPDRQPRIRRGGTAAKEDIPTRSKVAGKKIAAEVVEDEDADDDLADVESGETESDADADETKIDELNSEDRDLIEDTSDLGEDDDDIGEVMEHLDEDIEDKS